MGRKRKAKPIPSLVEFMGEVPTDQRLAQAAGYYRESGTTRRARRYVMLDDNLSRLLLRKQLSQEQYVALQRYALHWYAGGLAGSLSSFDLDRIRAMNPSGMGGLARNERELMHKKIYRDARLAIGEEPAYVADMVACHDYPLHAAGVVMGYASPHRGREKARELLALAGGRLDAFWQASDKRRFDKRAV
jgi:hypothetical protein